MKTPVVYVLISSENDYFLEELWVSLFSFRIYHPLDKVLILTDQPTAARIEKRQSLYKLISEIIVVNVPDDYNNRLRSRAIKTSVRNIIDGDFLTIDTDTIVCQPLDDIDSLTIKNIGMVPEMHGHFKEHLTYRFIVEELERIYNTDVSDAPYWFNSGCMLVRDNAFTRGFFRKWHENWKHATFDKNSSSDQRPLLKTDHDYGYVIEALPDVYNCQIALSIQYFHDAKILHLWHMRDDFFLDQTYSPFTSKEIYKQLKFYNEITPKMICLIKNCKNSFNSPSMVVGLEDINFLMSPLHTVLGRAYKESALIHWLLKHMINMVNYYLRAKNKFRKK